jgi:hypothetical protein
MASELQEVVEQFYRETIAAESVGNPSETMLNSVPRANASRETSGITIARFAVRCHLWQRRAFAALRSRSPLPPSGNRDHSPGR